MITLAQWLRQRPEERQLTQQAPEDARRQDFAVHAGVASAIVSETLHQGHLPRINILFRLANHRPVRFCPDDQPPTTSPTSEAHP